MAGCMGIHMAGYKVDEVNLQESKGKSDAAKKSTNAI